MEDDGVFQDGAWVSMATRRTHCCDNGNSPQRRGLSSSPLHCSVRPAKSRVERLGGDKATGVLSAHLTLRPAHVQEGGMDKPFSTTTVCTYGPLLLVYGYGYR